MGRHRRRRELRDERDEEVLLHEGQDANESATLSVSIAGVRQNFSVCNKKNVTVSWTN